MPYNMNNGIARQQLTDRDQLLFGTCIYIYPDASSDEIFAFVHVNGGEIYSPQFISKRCEELGLSQKRLSKESYAAFSASFIHQFNWFIILPPPLGVSGIFVNKLIDINETLFYLQITTTKYGRSQITCRACYPVHYTRWAMKSNIILAMDTGSHIITANMDMSVHSSLRWIHITTNNCDQFVLGKLVNTLLSKIERHPTPYNIDNERVILWDNLSAHKIPYILNMTNDQPSRNCFIIANCPPYRLRLTPIEYFNM